MTKYPNSECDAHRNVTTSAPVCIVCMDREIAALRKVLAEVEEGLENAVNEMPMFPITAENAEAAQDAMTGVCFTLGILRVRGHELVRAGEQGANA